MKKLYFILMASLITSGIYAQCVIDTSRLLASPGGVYPTADHLPHIVRDSVYDQSIQGKIQDTFSQSFSVLGFNIMASLTVDSVRLDSIGGLPHGITWTKSANVLPGGGYGCVEFTGTTSDSVGTYRLTPIGMAWAHLYVPIAGINKDTFQYGNLARLPQYGNFFLVVDSAPKPLSVTGSSVFSCFGAHSGSVTATAAGGSPTAPYTYKWNTGYTEYTINNLDSGTYYVTVYSATDSATSSVTVFSQPSPISLTMAADSGTIGANGTAVVTAAGGVPPYTYRWRGNGSRTDSITGVNPGTYIVTVRDSFGCVAADTAIIANLSSGISSVSKDIARFNLFPNPASKELNVVTESAKFMNCKLQIVDMSGRIVYSVPVAIANGQDIKTLNIEKFNAGLYTVQLIGDNQQVQQRFTVVK